jgi:hypothetical protein
MDAKKMNDLIETKAIWKVKEISVEVRIKDVRHCYDRFDALIEPICGAGQKWVRLLGLVLPNPERGEK